jgi:hypothetical protein
VKNSVQALLALGLALPLALSATASFANTAANTAIVNKAVLTYNGGLTAQSSVTVVVALVPSKPNATISPANGVYTSVDNQPLSNTVMVTATANGPATYTVAPSVSAPVNTTAPSVSGGASISLGATITAGTGSATSIVVPAPNGAATTNNSPVNGIGVGSIIVFTINSTIYAEQVTSTVYNSASNTFTINFGTALAAADVAGNVAGLQVGERQQVTLTAKPGTIVALGSNITSTISADVSAAVFGAGFSTAPTTVDTWTSTPPTISFQKYSRNVTSKVAGTSAPHSNANIEGNTGAGSLPYFTSGVVGAPGEIIEYIVEASNSGTSSFDLTNCAISDTLPTAYVQDPLLTPYTGTKQVFYIDNTGATQQTFDLTANASGGSLASYVSPNLVVNVGVGANSTTPGTIPIGKSVTIAYQVKIK